MKSPDRVALLRENYRLSQELGYVGFHHKYFNERDAIKDGSIPLERRGCRELREFLGKRDARRFCFILRVSCA